MMRGRSTCWRCFSSRSSTVCPAAVIGILSIVPGPPTSRQEAAIAGRRFRPTPRPRNFLPNSYRRPGRASLSHLAAEIALQRTHLEIAPKMGADPLRGGDGSGKSGVIRDFMQEGGAPERPAVGERGRSLGGIEDQVDLAILDSVDDMRPSLEYLVHLFGRNPVLGEEPLGPGGRDQREPELAQQPNR